MLALSLLVGDFDLMETQWQEQQETKQQEVPASRGLWFNGNIDNKKGPR